MATNIKNSFKKLEEEQSAKFRPSSENKVRENVNHNIGFFHFFGDIIELYLPKVFGLFVKMSGGGPSQNIDNNPNRASDNDRPKYPNTID